MTTDEQVRRIRCDFGDLEPVRDALDAAPHDDRPPLDALAGAAESLAITDLARAVALAEALVAVADRHDEERVRMRCRRALAQTLAYASRLDEALAALDEALALPGVAAHPIETGRLRLTRLHALARLGRYDEAVAEGERARRTFEDADEPTLAARTDLNLGVTHRMRGDAAEALVHFDRALPVLADEPIVVAQLESNRAEALLDLARFADAEAGFRRALEVFERLGIERACAIVEGNLADLMGRQGRLDEALRHFERARQRLGPDASPGERARLQCEQAETCMAAGLWREAATMYAEAAPVLTACGLAGDAARALTGHAAALLALDRPDDAESVLDEAETTLTRSGHRAALARAGVLRGVLAVARGRGDDARRRLEDAAATSPEASVERVLAQLRLAEVLLAAGGRAEAIRTADAALPVAERLGLAPMTADLRHVRGRALARSGRADEAIDDLRASIDGIERLRGRFESDRFRTALLGTRASAYEDLVSVLIARPDPARTAEAFAVAESAKSRSLLELADGAITAMTFARSRAEGGPEASLVDEVLRLQGELDATFRAAERLRDEPDGAAAPPRRKAVRALADRLRVAESRLAMTGPLGAVVRPPVDAARVAAALDEGSVLLEYHAIDGELIAFVVRTDGTTVVRDLATLDDVADLSQRLAFQIGRAAARLAAGDAPSARMTEATCGVLQRLHERVLAPLVERVPGLRTDVRRLHVVPHAALHGVPFAALHDGEAHLVERMEVMQSPSASLLFAGNGEPTEGRYVVVGVEDADAPSIEDEARRVAERLGDARSLVGAAATIERTTEAMRGARLVHFACHGRFRGARPEASGLRLADGWLTARDVERLRLDGATIVLGACESGRAAVDRGEELVGLARSFLAAGARTVVQSLWIAGDSSAADLLLDLYREDEATGRLAVETSATSALAGAQRRMLRRMPHPFFWSPFVVVERTA